MKTKAATRETRGSLNAKTGREIKYSSRILSMILAGSLLLASNGVGSEEKLPVIGGKRVVATVNDEVITMKEFKEELASLQEAGAQKGSQGKEEGELLKRLINARLIIQEARRMGLDESKELRERVGVFSRVTLREALIERYIKDIKPDEKEVEKAYRESIKMLRIKSILFEKEENARKMQEEMKSGRDFDEVLKKFLADKLGKGSLEPEYLKAKGLCDRSQRQSPR